MGFPNSICDEMRRNADTLFSMFLPPKKKKKKRKENSSETKWIAKLVENHRIEIRWKQYSVLGMLKRKICRFRSVPDHG